MSEGLRAISILDYDESRWYWGGYSPLYPSGPGAVTLSEQNCHHSHDGGSGHMWAIDVVVDRGRHGPLVYYDHADCPSVRSTSREIVTFPDYSCRAFVNGGVSCAALGAGQYAWASGE